MRLACFPALLLALLAGCSCDSPADPDGGPLADAGTDSGPPRHVLDTVPETMRLELPCLEGEVIVVRTEMDVPHIYASTLTDAYCVQGFVTAKDRFFEMDMAARLGQGELTELLGDAALANDIEQRMHGSAFITDRVVESLTAEEEGLYDAFAEGVNAYIEQVRARNDAFPPPSELATAAVFLGARQPVDLMIPWDRRDVAAMSATVLLSTSFEGGDVGRSAALARVDEVFPASAPDRDLRVAGLASDVMDRYAPPRDASSGRGWGLETGATATTRRFAIRRPGTPIPRDGARSPAAPQRGVLERLEAALERIETRTRRDPAEGFGSNVWAVSGEGTGTGHTLLAGDGHLQLSVPALFHQVGIDTTFLGDAETGRQLLGATIPGVPGIGVGTNGHVAWSQTAYFADVTDWYAEEIVLGSDGLPSASRFDGADRPLVRVDETYEIRNVPALGSMGRTAIIPRWTTFDGRWLTSIEGTPVAEGETPPGNAVNMMGQWIVPGDTDANGTVTAISFDYGPFDGGVLSRVFGHFHTARSAEDFRQAMRYAIGYGGNMIASDRHGDIVYTAYHSVPCRDYLPRDPDTQRWIEGADPRRLIDGTRYGGWQIPLDAEGRVDEAAATSAPQGCAVPFDQWPQSLSPTRNYLQHANNDPAGIWTDDDGYHEPWYIGGPWIEGYRGHRIEERLEAAIAEGRATLEEMQDIQGDHHSNLGEEWVPVLLEEIAYAREQAAASPTPGTADARLAALFTAERAIIEDVEARLMAWQAGGFDTPSGVETFYSTPAAGDHEDAVATMIFGTWFPRLVRQTIDDEGIPGALSPAVTGDTFRMGLFTLLMHGRVAGNPNMLASFDPTRVESVFFDDLTTPDVETSHEIAIRALRDALAFLRSEPTEPGVGGFGSDDPDDWIWGLRHGVRFDSLLADFIGDDPMFAPIVSGFSIKPQREGMELAPDLADTDPRAGLTFFPRPGDQFDVDAANPGLGGERFTHGSGPVFRLVVELGPDGFVRGENILPQGQSGLNDSFFFDDQVRLWLANETIPMRWTPEDVVDGANGRETFLPTP